MNTLFILPCAVTVTGLYFLFKLRFFFILNPGRTARKIFFGVKGRDAFSSVALALAGTLGIGNIIGVAVGISIGGEGSVFWLLISSIFAMVIKYSECALSSDFGEGKGMLGVISKSFGRASLTLSMVYAVLILALSFVMGAAFQSASIGQCALASFGIPTYISALFLLVTLVFAVRGGNEKIAKITAIIIPLTTVIYIILALSTIFANIKILPAVMYRVWNSAFDTDSAVGGIAGFLFSDKIKEGYLRGILSNEAGAGTSSIAHSKNRSADAGAVGVMGIVEVVFDTVILCSLTAFASLVSVENFSGMSGMGIILSGIGSVFGRVSEYLIFVCIFAFAYSTVICWYYYGSFAYEYLMKAKSGRAFASWFIISAASGAFFSCDSLIGTVDLLLLFLSAINLLALIKNSDRIKFLSENSGLIIPRRKY